jgi:hypothetical protein
MDKLKHFIEDHKAEFDDKVPDRSIWLSIENALDKDQKRKIIQFQPWKIAAGVILLLCTGILIGLNIREQRTQLNYSSSQELLQFKDTESYYMTQVNLKLDQIKDPASKASVSEDLKQLDEIYRQLKTEIIQSDYANSEVLIQAMIRNHKTKVEILENILNKQNQMQNENLSL